MLVCGDGRQCARLGKRTHGPHAACGVPLFGAMLNAMLCLGMVWMGAGVARGADLDDLPTYQSGAPLTGKLSLAGTDSMAPMLRRWIELFRTTHPGVEFHLETGAPPTAAAGLVAGTALIGYTGRTLFEAEIEAIVRAREHAPHSFRIGAGTFQDKNKTHTMAVFVHADNPLRQLTLAQARHIFSGDGSVVTWGQLGVRGEWSGQPIRAVVAKLGTGATNFVQEVALLGAAWSDAAKEFPTDEAAIAALAADRFAVCIAGLPYGTAAVRSLALSREESGPFSQPTREHVISRRYPLARLLYFHAVVSPAQSLDAVAKEFLRLVLSKEGQKVALESGYLPLTADIVRAELKTLE